MAKNKVKLAYVAAQFRVKTEITKSTCKKLESPPDDLIERAHAKMQSIQEIGEIDIFSVYKSKLEEFWTTCKNSPRLAEFETVSFTLAEGSPILNGVTVEPPGNENAVANLSIEGDLATIRSWRLEWVIFYVNHLVRQMDESRVPSPAQIHGAWLRAAAGIPIQNLLLGPLPPQGSPQEVKAKPYSIIANKAREEISLIIRDIHHVLENIGSTKITDLVNEAAQKVSEQFGGTYQTLRKEMIASIKQASNGPELVGLNMPMILLGATGAPKVAINTAGQLSYPGAGKLEIVVDRNSMSAVIRDFSTSLYDDDSFEAGEEWLKKEIRRNGIHLELCKPFLQSIVNSLNQKASLDGITIARGIKSQGGTNPSLRPEYLELSQEEKQESESTEVVNLRSLQQRQIVKPGQLVASIDYKHKPVVGRDVYGNPLEAVANAKLKIELGEGVEERESGKFYATIEGVPVVEENSLHITTTMIHEGDVNLRTGNIAFDGPVEIKGSIDSGAEVNVNGDLRVRGSIRNAFVRSGGDIRVDDGIVTGEKGRVTAKGDIKSEFIENSQVQCGGSLLIGRALLNSKVIAGGCIEVLNRKEGIIAGGVISCRENLITGHLGFRNGNITQLNIGVDWKAELSVRIRESRLEKVKEAQNKDRKGLREIMSRPKSQQKVAKNEDRKKHFQERLVKARALIEKMENHLEEAKNSLSFDPNAKGLIYETLFANVKVQVGGNPVMVSHDTAEVGILGKRKQGSNIVPIETALEVEKNEDEKSA